MIMNKIGLPELIALFLSVGKFIYCFEIQSARIVSTSGEIVCGIVP